MRERREVIADELLVLACQEGRSEAFRALVERWQEPLWRHAYRLTGRDDAAWDVVQEAWLAIAQGVHTLRDPSRFRAFAYTVVSRRAADWRAARGREPEATTPEALVAPVAEPNDAVTALREALRHVDGDKRALLSLRYVDGFELREIAQILGVPEGTVKSRLHHARSELRAVIERLQHE